jgi:hypothetical protein
MELSTTRCSSCGGRLAITRLACASCDVSVQGTFELPPLARLKPEDQIFVAAFVRHHGSIKKMEALFGISYPTVKNRLNAIARELDESFEASTPNLRILEALERGEITVDEALDRME